MARPARRMTPEEFEVWEETQIDRHHLWDGEVFLVHPPDDGDPQAMAGGSDTDAELAINAAATLKGALRGRGCRVFSGDLRVQIDSTGRYIYPDASVVCGEVRTVAERGFALLNPTLVVEVLSRSTEAFDRGGKAQAYRALPSVQAVVLVAQDRPAVEVHRREADGRWALVDALGLDAAVDLLGATVALADLYDGIEFDGDAPRPG